MQEQHPTAFRHGRALALITADPALAALFEELRPALAGDPAHDLDHCLRVADWTLHLLAGPPGAAPLDERHAVAAALLHDVINVPKNAPERAAVSERSAAWAGQRLRQLGFAEAAVVIICEAIADHSFSRGAVPRSALGCALQDADRLEAVGAIGVLRTVSTGASIGSRYLDPADPWARARELDDHRFTVDHFFRKLLRLPRRMNTAAGRREAQRRADFMREFLRQLAREVGGAEQLAAALDRLDQEVGPG
jgi:uncharacterized protein